MSTHLIIPDPHAHWQHDNVRADWLSNLIRDINPSVVVNLGDSADLPSLSSYDKGQRSFQGRTYAADIEAHLDFEERLWGPLRKRKKKLPRRIFIEGNHEHRIERALDLSPELVGTVSFSDLDLVRNYDTVVRYNGKTPGTIEVDGITYSHYFISGVKGLPLGGEHPGHAHITKLLTSTTSGHSHLLDYSIKTNTNGRKVMGLVAGWYGDYFMDWAGDINRLWSSGIAVKRNVEEGYYDLQWISLGSLKKEYGNG